MVEEFILLPDDQVFEAAFLAMELREEENVCLKLFKKAWVYYVDMRTKVILITKELDRHLIEKRYKKEKMKKQALFSVVSVHSEEFFCTSDAAQAKLASILSIKENKTVYYVTDNKSMSVLLSQSGIKVITSQEALDLIEKAIKEFGENVPDPTKLDL